MIKKIAGYHQFHTVRWESTGLNEDELAFYDALANNQTSAKELGDDVLKIIAQELTENLRKNISVDWAVRESVRAKLRLMVKRILRKYKYPQDKQDEAIELVLQQAETVSAGGSLSWGMSVAPKVTPTEWWMSIDGIRPVWTLKWRKCLIF